jgi:anti-sigma regulatory factor (Ser/Thr protein kinase)
VLDIPFDRTSLRGLRAAVAAYAAGSGLPSRRVGHLVTVAHELAANAIRHAGGTGWLRLWRDQHTVYCQVTDRGPGIADRAVGTTPPDLSGTSGRGMWICRQLCDGLTIDTLAAGGTTVTATMGRPAAPRHAARTRSQVPLRLG